MLNNQVWFKYVFLNFLLSLQPTQNSLFFPTVDPIENQIFIFKNYESLRIFLFDL